MTPIFFGITRSFWAYVVTVLLLVEQTGEPMAAAIGTLFALVTGGDPDQAAAVAVDLLPLVTLTVALQQRSGAARPYTLKANAETLT